MRTVIYEHRSGLKVVPEDIILSVKKTIYNINPTLSKNSVSKIKEVVRKSLKYEG